MMEPAHGPMSDRVDTGQIRQAHKYGVWGSAIDPHGASVTELLDVIPDMCDEIDRLRAGTGKAVAALREIHTWDGYDTRDIGRAFLADMVIDVVDEALQVLGADDE